MGTFATATLVADRAGACVRRIIVKGVDLTGTTPRGEIRLKPDTPGTPLVALANVVSPGEGVRLVSVETVDGVSTSTLELVVSETTMQDAAKVPYSGAIGDPSELAWAVVITLSGYTRTLVTGPFVVVATVFGADDAPTVRSASYGSTASSSGWSSVSLTFDDAKIEVSIVGFDLVAPSLAEAAAAAARAETAAETAASAVSQVATITDEVTVGYVGDLSALTLTGSPTDTNIVPNIPFPNGGTVLRLQAKAQGAGIIRVRVYSRVDDTFTMLRETQVTCVVGMNDQPLSLAIPENGYVGIVGPGVIGSAAGTATGAFNGGTIASPDFTDGSDLLTTVYVVQITAASVNPSNTAELRALEDEIAAATLVTEAVALGSTVLTGSDGSIAGAGARWRVVARSFAKGGTLDSATIAITATSAPVFATYSKSGDTFTPYALYRCPRLAVGTQTIAVDLPIPPGGYVGVFTPIGTSSRSTTQWASNLFVGTTQVFTDAAADAGTGEALVSFSCSETIIDGVADVLAQIPEDTGGGLGTFDMLIARATIFIGGAGQSNMEGNANASATSAARAIYGAQGYENELTTLRPLRGVAAPNGVGLKEYPGFGAAESFRARMMEAGYPANAGSNPVIVGRSAKDGTAIAALSKGTSYYSNGMAQLVAAEAAASGAFVHPGQMWVQGERDAILGTTKATYKAAFKTLAIDYDADSRTAVAGDYDRVTFAIQVSSTVNTALATAGNGMAIAMAQLEAARESDLIVIACPGYSVGYGDDRHANAAGSRVWGAYLARAMYAYASQGVRFEALQVVDSYISGSTIVLVYNRPGLAIDTTLVPAQTGNGFRVFNAGATQQTISSVAVNGSTVVLTMAGTPAAGWTWDYGGFNAVGMSPYAGGAGNIRDNAGAADTFDGVPLHNWALLQTGTL